MEKRPASEDTNPVRFSREESVRITNPKNPGSSKISWRRELNPRPSDYKSDALPAELRQPCANLEKLSHRQRNCKGLEIAPEAAPHTDARSDRASNFGLLRGWLRKISVIQLRVMMIPRHGNYYQRALIRLADCVRQLDSIDLAIILVVLLKLANSIRPMALAAI